MLDIFDVVLIFAIGCFIGWILESIFRSIVEKRLVNAGFLNGPYLPIYGFGTLLLYLMSLTDFHPIFKVLVFALSATLLELVTGVIFTEFYNLKLWDYSDEFLNFRGIICIKYTLFWVILASFYFLFVSKFILFIIDFFAGHFKLYILVGIFYGIFIIDVFHSLDIAYKLRNIVESINKARLTSFKLNYDHLKNRVGQYLEKVKKGNIFSRFFFSLDHIAHHEMVLQTKEFFKEKGASLKSGFKSIMKKVKKK